MVFLLKGAHPIKVEFLYFSISDTLKYEMINPCVYITAFIDRYCKHSAIPFDVIILGLWYVDNFSFVLSLYNLALFALPIARSINSSQLSILKAATISL